MTLKKKIKVVLSIVVILFLSMFTLLFILLNRGLGITIGRCLIADNDSYLLVDENSPTLMSTKSESMFSNLSTGDKIFVLHTGVEASYPGRTGVYLCLKLEGGDVSDIPVDVIRELTELNWLGENEETAPYKFENLTYTTDSFCISIDLLENWNYQLLTGENDNVPTGITIAPKDQSECNLSILYYPFGFGVKCGTGLEEQFVLVNNYKAEKGTYDDNEYWSYIHFLDGYEKYAILNEGDDEWLNKYSNDISFMLESLLVGDRVEVIEE